MIQFAGPGSASAPGSEASLPARLPRPSLGDEIARLSAHIEAATGRLLALIREFDDSGEWHEQGFTSCARWLSWRTGIGPGAARERVRVARALGELPAMSAALCAGQVSYSAARALTRVATPENEAELLEVARHTAAADLERLVGAWRRADRSEAAERADEQTRHESRGLWLIPEADGSWRIRGRMGPEDGALLQKALEAAEDQLYAEDRETPPAARRADAIGRVAAAALGEGLGAPADRYEVVVHVSAETLDCDSCDTSAETGREAGRDAGRAAEPPRIAHGPHIAADTARRLACDAGVVVMTHGPDGSVLDVGRRSRSVPAPIRRALDARDRTCRFPGCRSRFYQRHHVKGWTLGGETKLENLVLLCRRHHRLVHEGGWSVEMIGSGGDGGDSDGDGAGNVRFRRPDGTRLPRFPERPAVPEAAAEALEQEHEARGVRIDAWTVMPEWEGDRLDTDWALEVLR